MSSSAIFLMWNSDPGEIARVSIALSQVTREILARLPSKDARHYPLTQAGHSDHRTEGRCLVLDRGVKLSMDAQGAWRNIVFVERLWCSVKYERVYLGAYDSVSAARKDIAQYMDWYSEDRPYSSLNDRTPTEVWLESLLPLKEAA
ncbi:MAG: hypothetical protein EBV72_14025 [Betaproteobacteria bacterium]|nr:hypothetical protein [Betaproteobacteria bacterium]